MQSCPHCQFANEDGARSCGQCQAELSPVPAAAPGAEPALPVAEVVAALPSGLLPADARPKLLVVRGLRLNVEYPLLEGPNYIGRPDEKPVDIDLTDQEAPERVWSSRQHAVLTFANGTLNIEDLNSLNGTFVNRTRVQPGQQRTLQIDDIIQIGTVQMRVAL